MVKVDENMFGNYRNKTGKIQFGIVVETRKWGIEWKERYTKCHELFHGYFFNLKNNNKMRGRRKRSETYITKSL